MKRENNLALFSTRRIWLRKEALFGLIAACIPLIGYMLFQLTPLIISFVTMFVDMKGYDLTTMRWNNFENFRTVLTDKTFWVSLRNTALLLLGQFVSLTIALITSSFLSLKLPGTKFFTALFFVPYICSSVAVSIIWMTMFNNDYGVINDILVRLLGESAKIEWYNKPVPFFMMIFIILIWQAPGYGIVMYNAAFTAIPRSLYEAARVDGAGKWKQFIYITLPSISPTTFFLIMAGLISGLQQFDVPKMVTSVLGNSWTGEAGPNNAGLTTVVYIYNSGILFNKMPVAAVMSFLLFVIIMLATIINFRASRKWVYCD
ncbi:MAG: sugar ABC transporter permease [Clostridiaceae bacterium]|nr:sugar ABC transporter permease [Clostridiaceae bacterium]